MSAGDVVAIAHKGDFPMPQAGRSPSYSFERTYAKVGVLVRISGGRMFATLDLLSNGRAETRLAIAAPMLRAIELLGTRVAPLVRTALASETTAVSSLANAHAAALNAN